MAKKSSNAWIALALIFLVIFGVGIYTNWTFKFAVTPTPTETGAVPVGTFTMRCSGYNTLDVASSVAIGSGGLKVSWYAYRNGWVLLGAGDNVNIELEERDNGYIYVVCEGNSSWYIDFNKVQSMNSRVKSVSYEDVDGDSVKEWVFKYSMWNIPPAASGYPQTTFYLYALEYDSSFAFPAGGQPSDISSIGTSTVTKYIAWYMGASAEKKGVAVYKIEIKVNSTSTSLWDLKNVNVPGVGYLSGSNFQEQILETYTVYTYVIGSNLKDSVYWKLPPNVNNKFDLTVGIEFHFTAGTEVLQWTLTVYQLTPTETSVTDADSVITKAGS
ncbi:MAG: hypothetical protein QXR76_03460 [Candidatus Bathyarchaeia archaeon]